MNGTFRIFIAELMRLLGARAAWLGIGLALLVPALRVWASVLVVRAKAIERAASGGSTLGLSEGTGWQMLVDGWNAGLVLCTAMLLVQAARAIAGDRETGVLRLAVTRSASRSGAVMGRALMGPVLVVALIGLTGFGAWATTVALGGDFGGLVEDDYEVFTGPEVQAELIRSLLVVAVAMVAVHSFGILTSSLSRGPLFGLASSLALVLLWDVFKDDAGNDRWFVFASHAPTFANGSAMHEMASFARAMSDAGLSESVVRMGLILSPVQALLFVGLACLAVRRRPL